MEKAYLWTGKNVIKEGTDHVINTALGNDLANLNSRLEGSDIPTRLLDHKNRLIDIEILKNRNINVNTGLLGGGILYNSNVSLELDLDFLDANYFNRNDSLDDIDLNGNSATGMTNLEVGSIRTLGQSPYLESNKWNLVYLGKLKIVVDGQSKGLGYLQIEIIRKDSVREQITLTAKPNQSLSEITGNSSIIRTQTDNISNPNFSEVRLRRVLNSELEIYYISWSDTEFFYSVIESTGLPFVRIDQIIDFKDNMGDLNLPSGSQSISQYQSGFDNLQIINQLNLKNNALITIERPAQTSLEVPNYQQLLDWADLSATSNVNLNNNSITGITGNPFDNSSGVNYQQLLNWSTLSAQSNIEMNNNNINDLADAVLGNQAPNYTQLLNWASLSAQSNIQMNNRQITGLKLIDDTTITTVNQAVPLDYMNYRIETLTLDASDFLNSGTSSISESVQNTILYLTLLNTGLTQLNIPGKPKRQDYQLIVYFEQVDAETQFRVSFDNLDVNPNFCNGDQGELRTVLTFDNINSPAYLIFKYIGDGGGNVLYLVNGSVEQSTRWAQYPASENVNMTGHHINNLAPALTVGQPVIYEQLSQRDNPFAPFLSLNGGQLTGTLIMDDNPIIGRNFFNW